MKKNNSGFSLVELIIVIAIMAVLIGVLAPQFIKYVEKSKENKDITNLDSCVTAVQAYYADKEMPTAGVIITAAKGSALAGNDTDNAALKDAGATNSIVTGNWTTNISATVKPDGEIVYAGVADYIKAADDGHSFEAKAKSNN